MPTIKLRFVTSADPISACIRRMTDFPYSHVEFVLDADWQPDALDAQARLTGILTVPPYDWNQWTLGAHLGGGVRVRPFNYDKFSATELATIECTAEQKQAAIKGACACIGSPYDTLTIAGILLHVNLQEKGHWICSTFVSNTLLEAGIVVLRIAQPDLIDSITPRDVYLSPLLKRVAA